MHAEFIERFVPKAPVPPVAAGRQHGAALMIMLLILVLGAAALFAHDLAGRTAATARIRKSATALAEAKEALLGYALAYDATHPGEFGFLPCPDISAVGLNPEGTEDTALCGLRYQTMMGRLPWRSLGIAPARNDTGECLLYVVSGTWKASGLTQPEMLNTDSNGQLRLFAADGTVAAGANAADRPVALIIAPHGGLAGQLRLPLASGVTQCSGNFVLSNYLDLDASSGIDNSNVSLLPDAIDDFMAGDAAGATVNDQFAVITRAELENRLTSRADLTARFQSLTQAVARCIADHGKHNAAGVADRRLPWPAPVDLAQYRSDSQYDDSPVGGLSGRVADRVNDSNLQTGNLVAGVLTNCNPAAVPEWTADMLTLWRNWKDHLFYAVAGSFRPDAAPHSTCGTCLRVNGAGSWAAVVMFAGARLPSLGQVRDEPPADADTRSVIANYLEGRNATNHPNAGGNADYQSAAATATFNDVLYCIDSTLNVAAC